MMQQRIPLHLLKSSPTTCVLPLWASQKAKLPFRALNIIVWFSVHPVICKTQPCSSHLEAFKLLEETCHRLYLTYWPV